MGHHIVKEERVYMLTAIVAIWLRSPHSARNVKINDCKDQSRMILVVLVRLRKRMRKKTKSKYTSKLLTLQPQNSNANCYGGRGSRRRKIIILFVSRS